MVMVTVFQSLLQNRNQREGNANWAHLGNFVSKGIHS